MFAGEVNASLRHDGRREIAEAEPAVPEWTMPVDDLFEELE
jgi:hypothetical protein